MNGQNKHLSIGANEAGICFGNSMNYSGIRLNWIDKNVFRVNGINFGLVTRAKKSNGFSFGLVANHDSIINGIAINGLVSESNQINGVLICGLAGYSQKINGLGIGGFGIVGDTMNGVFVGVLGSSYWNTEVIKVINGCVIGLAIGSNTNKMNGVTLSLFNNVSDTLNGVAVALLNHTKELHGIQLGLWNVAENNRILKKMPLLNINFRRKK